MDEDEQVAPDRAGAEQTAGFEIVEDEPQTVPTDAEVEELLMAASAISPPSEQRLGVVPATPAQGCLQDMHWAIGSFGYFPSYALGAFIAAQLYESLRIERPGLDDEIAKGQFGGLFECLRANVHSLGASVSAPDLIKLATGKPLSAALWLRYAEGKYLEAIEAAA